jgi:hypothetical protein
MMNRLNACECSPYGKKSEHAKRQAQHWRIWTDWTYSFSPAQLALRIAHG